MARVIVEALVLGTLLGVGLLLVASSLLPPRKPTLTEFLIPYVVHTSEAARQLARRDTDGPMMFLGQMVSPAVSTVVTRLNVITGGGGTFRLLTQLGSPETLSEFSARRSVSAIVGALALSGVMSVVGVVSGSPTLTPVPFAAIVGAIAGMWWVDYRIKRAWSERHDRVAEEFPIAIEMLGLALAAGDSLPRALSRLSSRMSGELGREWSAVMREVDLGRTLGESLRDSASRLGHWRVTAFVEHLVQALERGTPLREVVASHAEDAAEDRSRSVVDRAGKAEVQMLVPMVLLILPITVLFAVWPGLRALELGVL